jgi:sugar phosphate isomerase/epimerase
LVINYLGGTEKRALEEGNLDLASVNAIGLERAKLDVEHQIEVTRELGLNHIELDTDTPNPYLNLSDEAKRRVREAGESSGITFSVHLPYSYVGGALCSPQESDRRLAVELHKRCIRFAADIGAKYVNVHPGSAPFYHRVGKYRDSIHAALLRSLLEMGELAGSLGLDLHLENNTAFDGIYSEVGDCLSIIRELRERGLGVYFNLDIGHWFTRADVGSEVPEPPEKIMDEIPSDYVKELHLNDYVPGKKMFHPPLHLEWGLLKRGSLEGYAEIIRRKGAEVIVLETALKTPEQLVNWRELLRKETRYVKEIFG